MSHLFHRRSRRDHGSAQIETHWLDLWLPRISHFSQFGLFAVTIGGLYFTVLPLYQKAVLEEVIARKEVQLASSTKALQDGYVRLRRFVIRDFVFGAGTKCSSVMLPLPPHRASNEEPYPAISEPEAILRIDAGACLKAEFPNSKSLKDLRPADLQILASHVDRIAANVAAERKSALEFKC